jgi:1,4-dihydroxy-2-naphthoyl-CoA synthase
MNLTDDGMVGQQVLLGEATRLAYMTEEAKEVEMLFLKSENLILKEMVAIKFQYIKLKKLHGLFYK